MLKLLETPPDGYDIFHSVACSNFLPQHNCQQIGEVDIVVVSPEGMLLLMEVKAGKLAEIDGVLHTSYGQHAKPKNIEQQTQRQHRAMQARLKRQIAGGGS